LRWGTIYLGAHVVPAQLIYDVQALIAEHATHRTLTVERSYAFVCIDAPRR
jgi:hypothetical protein